ILSRSQTLIPVMSTRAICPKRARFCSKLSRAYRVSLRKQVRKVINLDLFKGMQNNREALGQMEQLLETSYEVVLFGSRSINMHRSDSDFDLFCIGEGKRIKTKSLDVLWLTPSSLNQQEWLGSELASHIASFGVWLKGVGGWRSRVQASDSSVRLKQRQILSL